MSALRLIRQGEEILYPELLFNRPVNPIHWPMVALIGGQAHGFAALNHAYEAVSMLGCRVDVYTPQTAAAAWQQPLAGMPLHTFDPADQAATEHMWQQLEVSASLAVLGLNSPLASQLQVRYEELLQTSTLPVLVTGEVLPLFTINRALLQRPNVIMCCDLLALIRLINGLRLGVRHRPARGVFGIHELVMALGEEWPAGKFILTDPSGVYVFAAAEPQQLGVLTLPATEDDSGGITCGVMAAALSFPLRSTVDFTRQAMNGCWMLAAILRRMAAGSTLAAAAKQTYRQAVG